MIELDSSNIVTHSANAYAIGAILTSIFTAIVEFIKWLIKKGTVTITKAGLTKAIYVASWAVSATVIAFVINTVITISNIINDFLDLFQSLSSGSFAGSGSFDCVAQNISAGLSASGLLDGLNAGMPIVSAAFAVYISVVFYILLSKLRKSIENQAINMLNTYLGR